MFTQASEWGNPCSELHTHHSPRSVACKKLYCSLFQLIQRPFCVFCCFPLLQSCTQPIFLLLLLLLLCPASFFGLFAGCNRAWIPAFQHKERLSPNQPADNTGTHCGISPGQGQGAPLSRSRDPRLLAAEWATGWGTPWLSIQPVSAVTHMPLVLLYSHTEGKKKKGKK